MFQKLKDKIEAVKSLNENSLMQYISENEGIKEEIVYLNTEVQLYEKGIDSLGRNFAPDGYSILTIEGTSSYLGKKQKGQRFDHVTLKDSGKYYDSHKVVLTNDFNLRIKADTEKEGGVDLTRQYGKDIIGLTDESLSLLKPLTIQVARNYVLSII